MKTDVMRERIKDIDPNIKVETYETFVLPDNAKELLEQKLSLAIANARELLEQRKEE